MMASCGLGLREGRMSGRRGSDSTLYGVDALSAGSGCKPKGKEEHCRSQWHPAVSRLQNINVNEILDRLMQNL